jgi:hypothetical protein
MVLEKKAIQNPDKEPQMKGISRRHFCQTSSLLMAGLAPALQAATDPVRAIQYEAMEWSYTSRKAYADPFNEVELDVVVTHSDKREQRVPAFWAGEQNWTVRFSPYRTGVTAIARSAAIPPTRTCMAAPVRLRRLPIAEIIRSIGTAP